MEPHEKMEGRQFAGGIDSIEFRQFIGKLGVIDLGYAGPIFI